MEEESKTKITLKYLQDNKLWDSYWLEEKYPERFATKIRRLW